MEKKKIYSFVSKLKKEERSFGAMGGVLLTYALRALSDEDLMQLFEHTVKQGYEFSMLDNEVNARDNLQF